MGVWEYGSVRVLPFSHTPTLPYFPSPQASFMLQRISNTLVGLGGRLFLVRAATSTKPCHLRILFTVQEGIEL